MLMDESVSGYDVIGDVHGCIDALTELLGKMQYQEHAGVWQHPDRKAVFVGDIIDRGPRIRDAMRLVRKMVDAGHAYMVLGNHEYNAVVYSSTTTQSLSAERAKYFHRLGEHLKHTLQEYRTHQQEWMDTIQWIRRLPISLEFHNFRVVHACWDSLRIGQAKQFDQGHVLSSDTFLLNSVVPASAENRIIERLLKGIDMVLPDGQTITGADGIKRSRFRTKFWSRSPQTYGDVLFQPDKLPNDLMQKRLTDAERQRLLLYDVNEKPLFVGHYWCDGEPSIIRKNIACLDYSAVKQGKLVAYRIGQESSLNNQQFVWVDNRDNEGAN